MMYHRFLAITFVYVLPTAAAAGVDDEDAAAF